MTFDPNRAVTFPWLVLAAFWVITAVSAKRTLRRESNFSRLYHLLFMIAVFALLFSHDARIGQLGLRVIPQSREAAYIGLALTSLGAAFAIWARLTLGRNWSATVTVIVGNLSSIEVTSQNGFNNITYGSSEQFVATGIASGQQINLTDAVTWSTNPAAIPNVSIDSKSGLLTTTAGLTQIVQFDVVATDPTTGIFGSMQFTVHQ